MSIYRCRYNGTFLGGDLWSTSLYTFSSILSTTQMMVAWKALITAFVGTTLKPLWAPDVSASDLIVDLLDEATGKAQEQARDTYGATGTGAGTTQIPQRNSLVIGLRTPLPTKAGRGRMFWPPLNIATLDGNGFVLQAQQTAIANAFGTQLSALKPNSQAVVYHRPVWNRAVKPPVLVTAGTHTFVNAVTVGKVLGTQRRRSNKVPANYQTSAA